jgi:hypothetical protein
MRKLSIITIVLLVSLSSCSDINKKSVKYVATGAISAYSLQYLNDDNELVKTEIVPQSAQDQWTFDYLADEGDIVYLNGNYKDINSSLKLMILVDGKVYKQASNTFDTIGYLTISGTIPISN